MKSHNTGTWIEQGEHKALPGDTLTAIEQVDFGIVCAILDYEGESVYRILNAINTAEPLAMIGEAVLREGLTVTNRRILRRILNERKLTT